MFTITWEREWKRLEVRVFGFGILEALWAGAPRGQRHARLCILTALCVHLFVGYPNYLGRYRKGWEFSTSTLRYGSWANRFWNWSIGWGGDAYSHTTGPSPVMVYRWGQLAFVNHNWKYVYPPMDDATPEDDEVYDEEDLRAAAEFDAEQEECHSDSRAEAWQNFRRMETPW